VGENRVHILDLDPGTDPWAGVRRKHREWVRKAEKAGVDVAWVDADTPADEAGVAMDRFEAVYAHLVDRLGLATHGPAYTRELFDRFRTGRRLQLTTAMLGDVPVAAMLHVTFGDTMVWYAGGQSDAGAPVGAGKLLLWRAIQRAHELGFRRYHMWGTATDSLAHYKEGFGAREERYLGTRALGAHPMGDRLVRAVWGARQVAIRLRQARRPGRGAGGRRAARADT
jgi:lipid II:glycine glycyltransferase (peptidoglycan interpeptide bridge formation enzyme)